MRDECTREAIRHLQFAAVKCAAFVGRDGLLHDIQHHWRRVRVLADSTLVVGWGLVRSSLSIGCTSAQGVPTYLKGKGSRRREGLLPVGAGLGL